MKTYLFSLIMIISLGVFAQADAQSIQSTLENGNQVIDFLINPPIWLQNAIIITGAALLAVQTILRRFPTENSVKIGGIIGRILDVLALFPPDNKKGGGTHKH